MSYVHAQIEKLVCKVGKKENQMIVRLFKMFELGWSARAELKKWLHLATKRDGFTGFDNPSLEIASATNERGETVVHAAVEPCYLLSAYMPNPAITNVEEMKQAGDQIDAALAAKAQREGRSKLLILVPDSCPSFPDERWVRIIEREVPLPVTAHVAGRASNQIARAN
jgi:hypothetical protein